MINNNNIFINIIKYITITRCNVVMTKELKNIQNK